MDKQKISKENKKRAKRKTHQKGNIFALPVEVKNMIDKMLNDNKSVSEVEREVKGRFPDMKLPSYQSFLNYRNHHFIQHQIETALVNNAVVQVTKTNTDYEEIVEATKKLVGRYHPLLIWLRQCERIEEKIVAIDKEYSGSVYPGLLIRDLEAQLNNSAKNMSDVWEKLSIKDRSALAGINSLIVNVINGKIEQSDKTNLEEAQEEMDFAEILAGLGGLASDETLEIIEGELVGEEGNDQGGASV